MANPAPMPTGNLPRWAQLLPRLTGTYYGLGDRITNAGRIYQTHAVTGAGTTGGGAGPTTTGASIADGSVLWDYVGEVSPAWGAGVYARGARAVAGGNLYQVAFQPAGAPASSVNPSTWPTPTTNPIGPLVDGYVWTFLATATASIVEPTEGTKDIGWVAGAYPPAEYMNWLAVEAYFWIRFLRDLYAQAITWTAAHVFQAGVTITQSTVNGDAVTATANGTGTALKGTATTGKGVDASSVGGTAVLATETSGKAVDANATSGKAVVATATSGRGVESSVANGIAVLATATTGTALDATSTGSSDTIRSSPSGSGQGVKVAHTGSGVGVFADNSGGTGVALQGWGNATRSPLELRLQARPSTPQAGEIYIDDGLGAHLTGIYWYDGAGWHGPFA